MFTGIIENLGAIVAIEANNSNISFFISSTLVKELKIDQSISHNGVCLTVESIENDIYKVTAIDDTLKKTNLSALKVGDVINIERCMPLNGRLDGHIVQGHVDTVAKCITTVEKNGSWEFTFSFDQKFAAYIIEKGSICVNGISLTAFNVTLNSFTVAIIPYTYTHTNMQYLQVGDSVNIEFDVLGKYILRSREVENYC
jgi:riboflavin synthase